MESATSVSEGDCRHWRVRLRRDLSLHMAGVMQREVFEYELVRVYIPPATPNVTVLIGIAAGSSGSSSIGSSTCIASCCIHIASSGG